MKRTILLLAFLAIAVPAIAAESFYSLSATDIDGNLYSFEQLKGKKVMIVNTASYCGYTTQYKTLQDLYVQYGGENFEILGFPSQDFNQEKDNEEDIKDFCELNYGVTFKMFSLAHVKGNDQHPVYQWLTKSSKNGSSNNVVNWNFEKFLINENGILVDKVQYSTQPNTSSVINWLNEGVAVEDEIEISVFPNPAIDYISFSSSITNLVIYDAIGSQVIESSFVNANESLAISKLASGVYFIKINGRIQKFIKL